MKRTALARSTVPMDRGAPMRRTERIARGRRRPGVRRAERVAAGGALAVGRAAESRAGLKALRARVIARAQGRDEIFRDLEGRELAHVVPRSAGGADDEHNCLWLHADTHRMHTARYDTGRLLLTPGFLDAVRGVHWQIVRSTPERHETGKEAYRRGAYVELGAGFIPTTCATTSTVRDAHA